MSQAVRGEAPILSRTAFLAIFAVMLVSAIGNTGLISVVPAIGREIGIADYLVASIFSLSALVWAIASPHWARLADRKGRKPLILLGLWGFIGSMVGCGLVVLAGLKAMAAPFVIFLAFLLIRSSYGLLGSASATAGQAYVADRTFGTRRIKSLAALSGAINLGSIVGPALAPFFIIWPLGLAGPMFVFAAGACIVLVAAGYVIPRDAPLVPGPATQRERPSSGRLWRSAAVRPFLAYGLLSSSMQAINTYTLGFLVIDRLQLAPVDAQAYIGQAMACGAIAGLAAQWGIVGILGMTPRAMMRWGAFLPFLGNGLIVVEHGFLSLLAAFAVASFGYGLARPGFAAGASLAVDQRGQGAVAGAVSSIAGASIVVPPIIAILLYQLSPTAPFLVVAIMLAGLFLYTFVSPQLRGIVPAASENVS